MKKTIVLLLLMLFIGLPTLAEQIYADAFHSYSIKDGITFDKLSNKLNYTLLIKDLARDYNYKVSVTQNLYNNFISIYSFEAYDKQNKFIYDSKDLKSTVNDDLKEKQQILKTTITQTYTNCKAGYATVSLYCTK